MLNRIFKISTLFVLALVFSMTSCQKESLSDLTTENFTNGDTEMSNRGGKGHKGKGHKGKGPKGGHCFKPIFPVTLNFPDGSSTEVADRDAAKEAIEAWKEANPDATERPSIAFPYDVMLKDSTVLTIESEEDLAALRETCDDGKGHGHRAKCFTPVFPITINFPDGSSEEVANQEEAHEARKAWKEANPDATERPTIAMPFDVMLKDSTVLTIENEEDLAALKESCDDGRGHGPHARCFTPVFPLTIEFPDGSSVEVADKDAAKAAVKEWKTANPGATERPSIAFPHDVELEDGTIVTVNSKEEVQALKESCRGNN